MKKAIVLLSGGQDSTTCLFWALKQFNKVLAVGFDYGQKHRQELVQAQKIAHLAKVEYKIFNLKGLLGGSSLTDHAKDHNEPHTKNNNLPASFTAGRNALFLTLAASFGYEQGIQNFVIGTCQTDYSGYPDCRQEFIGSQIKTLSLALETEIKIYTPLMFLTKAQTWKMAQDLGCFDIVRDYSMTDYNGDLTKNEWGYGVNNNPATALRVKGFEEAKAAGWI